MSDIKAIVPISGGKDSQVCLKLAVAEFGSEHVLGLFCDTQNEHPITYAHVKKISELYGVEIVTRSAGSVKEQCEINKRFPLGRARFCTDRLKIQVAKKFYKEWSDEHGPVQVWYGMRHDESADRAARYANHDPDDLYPPHEVIPSGYPQYLAKAGVMFRLPILDWTTDEVFAELAGEENPLYAMGFDRVGCFPCLAGGDKLKIKAFNFDDFGRQQQEWVIDMENQLQRSAFGSQLGYKYSLENGGIGDYREVGEVPEPPICPICNM